MNFRDIPRGESAIKAAMSRRQFARTAVGTAVVGATLGSGQSGAQVPPPRIGEAWVAFWNSGNVSGAAALFTDNVFYEDVTFGVANHGLKELQTFAQGFFSLAAPDSRFTLVRSDLRAEHGYIEWIWSSTDTIWRTGKKFSVRGASTINLSGNRIARNSDYWDLATVFRQIGLLPPGL